MGPKYFIDTHTHIIGASASVGNLTDKGKTWEDIISLNSRYPEIFEARFSEEPDDISDALIDAMDLHGINHAIIQQTLGRGTNDMVAETVKKHPNRFFGLMNFGWDEGRCDDMVMRRPGNWPSDEQLANNRARAAEEVARCVEGLGLKGVGEFWVRRFSMEVHPEKIVKDMMPFMDIVAKYKIPIQIGTAWSQFPHGQIYRDPVWTDELAYSYPEVPVILTKMGRGTHHFETCLSIARRNVNVYFDIVGTIPKHIRKAVDTIGAHRIMFGTDWSATWRWVHEPMDVYSIHKKLLDDANLSPAEREQIAWQTAAEVFRLAL